VKTLPYTFPNFVAYTRKSVKLFKALEVVPSDCHGPLDSLVRVVEDELDALTKRIGLWATGNRSPEQQLEHDRMLAKQPAREDAREALAKMPVQSYSNVAELEPLSLLKGNDQPDWHEGFKPGDEEHAAQFILDNEEYADEKMEAFLGSWQQVLLGGHEEAVDGCMIQVRWWYEAFMPALCKAFTVRHAADLTDPSEAEVDAWFHRELANGAFDPYGPDMKASFRRAPPLSKLMLSRAWQLTADYLNGVQKQRERQSETVAHRATGGVARYVPFIDVYLHRMFVANAEMRVSFPYYLGYSTWRLFHTVPEIMAARAPAAADAIVGALKGFLATFVTMYPCPFCRHHLNAYVLPTCERDTYPIEYTLLGLAPGQPAHELTPADKLGTITDAASARMFMWKLHNAVNSSIERSEEWYRRAKMPVYTSRFWPNLDAEVARAKVADGGAMDAVTVEAYTAMSKPMAHLERLRKALLEAQTPEAVQAVRGEAAGCISLLEAAVISSGYLQRIYRYNPDLRERRPAYTDVASLGEFARSDHFVLW